MAYGNRHGDCDSALITVLLIECNYIVIYYINLNLLKNPKKSEQNHDHLSQTHRNRDRDTHTHMQMR